MFKHQVLLLLAQKSLYFIFFYFGGTENVLAFCTKKRRCLKFIMLRSFEKH